MENKKLWNVSKSYKGILDVPKKSEELLEYEEYESNTRRYGRPIIRNNMVGGMRNRMNNNRGNRMKNMNTKNPYCKFFKGNVKN